MAYTFAPASTLHQNHSFLTWENAFSDEEIDIILNICNKLNIEKATLGGTPNDEDFSEIRVSKVGWLNQNPETMWIYDRLAYVARNLNAKFYGFDLFGFVEDMQFTIYDSETYGHYTWHIDMSEASPSTRKLSLVLQLSDPSEYEGGELQTMNSKEPSIIDKKKGLIAAFPGWALHRVTPVTSGIRKTLVVWIAGPQFK